MIEWYATELEVLEASSFVTLHIYSTRSSLSSAITPSSRLSLADPEKSSFQDSRNTPPETPISPADSDYDPEKHPDVPFESSRPSRVIASGRPHITQFINQTVEKADINDRIIVTACGPDSLMQTARKTVAGCIKADGPSLELYCEQFGF